MDYHLEMIRQLRQTHFLSRITHDNLRPWLKQDSIQQYIAMVLAFQLLVQKH